MTSLMTPMLMILLAQAPATEEAGEPAAVEPAAVEPAAAPEAAAPEAESMPMEITDEEDVEIADTASPVRVDFSGYADFEAEWSKSDPIRRIDFDTHHFTLYTTATVLEKVSAFAELEFEHGGEFKAGSTGIGVVKAERMWVEGYLHEMLNLRGGKTLTPYGLWAEKHAPTQRETTLRPLLQDDGPFPKELTGAMAFGLFFVGDMQLTYELGAFNGPGGSNPHEKDGNVDKTGVARLKLEMPMYGITAALSGYRGKDADTKRIENAGDIMLVVDTSFATLIMEGAYGHSTLTNAATVNHASAYAEVAIKATDEITPVLRFDYNDKDLDQRAPSESKEGQRVVAGINYRPLAFVVVRMEYAYHMREKSFDTTIDQTIDHTVIAAVAVSF